ncbi:LuxR family transcriptional regulator [Paractinoplanes ferrugineus]|uniref:LuxR family transcriptional regulator n=1 Tax=Paractinoplanes ferrugineus TaxID=113564 RepID=A0A919MFI6_9ACTN|nr:LuxR family transcriptional regulator [Actinoplanes ferrugineus]GIE13833.1 LuxR family transcriptional regulator [Actinoplanes ferrugineus]
MLIGRGSQLRRLTAMLEAVRTEGSALVLRGEPGIGRTAILAAARDAAGGLGLRVLHTAGVRGESDMPLAGLHRLLRPLAADAGSLDARHRSLLDHAFGLGELHGEALMQVALATLELLSSVAKRRPLLLIADDVHWLDRESREVIAFVARRAGSDPIVVLGAVREGYGKELGDAGIAALTLPRLSDRDAADLLDAGAPGLAAGTRVLILAEAAGNPLGLIELPSHRTLGALHQGVSGPLPVTRRLAEAFGCHGRTLPASTAALLLLCATDATASTSEILAGGAALTGQPMTLSDLEPAIDAALLRADENGLNFRHPLMRSATYQAAGLQARYAAHTALARVLDVDQDRAIWHRAASAIGPDAFIAQQMDDRARRADGRGAALQAATSLGRAAELTADDHVRSRRLLRAAELAFEVGRADLVSAFVDRTSAITLDAVGRARADNLRPFSFDDPSGERTRVGSLVMLAEAATARGDPDAALELLLGASVRSWWADPGEALRARLTRAAEATPVDRCDVRLLTTLAVADPITHGARVSEHLPRARPATAQEAHLLGIAAHAVTDFATSHQIFRTAVDKLRSDGRFGLLTHVEAARSWSSLLLGDWDVAGTAAEEGLRLGRLTGQPVWSGLALATLAALAGVRGDEQRAQELATEAESVLLPARVSMGLARVQIARGLTELSAGRYEQAHTQLARCLDPQDAAHHDTEQFGAVGFFADSAALTGRQAEARVIVDRLRARVESAGLTGVMAGLDHARPLVATDEDAEAAFVHALRDVVPPSPFDRARCNLFYGMWLRRRRRVVESRGPLREAREAFDRLDAPAWGARTRQELRAAGDADIMRSRAAWAELSSQELQIAQMAAAGLSNRDIGSRLYLSHRTVGSHLYRIFPKLGITSRGQLNGVLPGRSEAVDPEKP